MAYIAKKDLIHNEIYECDARNFTYGIWNKKRNGFEYIRHKFGLVSYFQDREYHYDDGPPYGTCKPLKHLTF